MKNNVEREKQSLIVIILQILFVILLFVDGMFVKEQWQQIGYGMYRLVSSSNTSFFQVANDFGLEVIFCLFVFSVITSIVINCLTLFKEKFEIKKWFHLINILSICLFIFFTIKVGIRDEWGYDAIPNTLFYIELFILLVETIISLYMSFGKAYKKKAM